MNIDTARLDYLFNRYFNSLSTQEEKAELHAYLNDSETGKYVKGLMQTAWESYGGDGSVIAQGRSEEILNSILAGETNSVRKPAVFAMPVWKYVAAASLLLVLGATYIVLVLKNDAGEKPLVTVNTPAPPVIAAPESNRAVITLGDGRKIYLDDASEGELAQLGDVNLARVGEDEVVYSGNEASDIKVEFNTLTVPRGSKVVQLRLADGTRIWLNAASSLRYPTAFPGNERVVEITGEAYFEVAHDPAKKFYVSGRGIKTEVLGTHFNVNMYDDESEVRVTLLEGSVNVIRDGASQMLKPRQQVRIGSEGNMNLVGSVDVDDVVAWKNGQFSLKATDITELMRQVSRWYDVDVVYQGSLAKRKFGGSVNRNVSLNTLMDALKEHGVHCELNGRTLSIK